MWMEAWDQSVMSSDVNFRRFWSFFAFMAFRMWLASPLGLATWPAGYGKSKVQTPPKFAMYSHVIFACGTVSHRPRSHINISVVKNPRIYEQLGLMIGCKITM